MYACGITEVQADRRQAHFVLPQTLAHFRSRIDEALMDELIAIQAAAAMDEGLVKQSPQSMRRNRSPVKRVDGLLLLCHKHLSGALVELVEIAQTPPRANGLFHRPPKAFHGLEVMATVSG
jgi:hypothetical protein